MEQVCKRMASVSSLIGGFAGQMDELGGLSLRIKETEQGAAASTEELAKAGEAEGAGQPVQAAA